MQRTPEQLIDQAKQIEEAEALYEIVKEQKNFSLCDKLLGTIGKLKTSYEQSQFRQDEVLSKDALIRFSHAIGSIVYDELVRNGIGPECRERIVLGINTRLLGTIDGATNTTIPRIGFDDE